MKRIVKLPIIAALLGAAAVITPAQASVVLNDNFDSYTNGNLSGQGGWTATTGAATPMQVAGAGDKYVQLLTGQDEYKAFSSAIPSIPGNTLSTSLTVNISAATAAGDYFAHLSDPVGTTTNFSQRLFARSSGAGFQLGILGTSGGTTVYGTTVLNFNQDYDVDVNWGFVAGAMNDTFAVNVNSSAYVNHVWDSATAEPTQLSAANLRQAAGNAATVQVDDYVVDGIIPEPASAGMLAMGALLGLRRRK